LTENYIILPVLLCLGFLFSNVFCSQAIRFEDKYVALGYFTGKRLHIH